MTSQRSSCHARRSSSVEQALHDGLGLLLRARERGVAADDRAVVGEADPAAVGVLALGVEHEVHGALGADVAVGGGVVAHEDLAVPEAELAAPEVAAAFVLGAALERLDLDGRAVLREADGLGGDQLLAFVEGLPGGPPGAVELDAVARDAGELVERDAERGGQAVGDAERRLLLAALVAVDLAEVDAGRAPRARLGRGRPPAVGGG